MGHVRSRFFTHLPANAPVHPPKIQHKSLFWNILPITPLFLIFYAANVAYLHENKDLRGRGRGRVHNHDKPQTGNATRLVTSHWPPASVLVLPLRHTCLPGVFMRKSLISLVLVLFVSLSS